MVLHKEGTAEWKDLDQHVVGHFILLKHIEARMSPVL